MPVTLLAAGDPPQDVKPRATPARTVETKTLPIVVII
jgi:hypothetical protein